MLRIINILTYALIVLIVSFQSSVFAQNNKPFTLTESDSSKDNIYMTWNKNTPESEMKDDIKALNEKGITIKYSNVKRNAKDEIVAIKVEYSDRKGNKGTMELNNQKPINTIKFYKQDDEVGFGEPSNANQMYATNPFFNGNGQPEDFMKHFNFGNGGTGAQSFNFSFPDGENFGNSKSKMIIKKDGKKTLVIEDGEVVEGGDDYTKEELEEIKKNNKIEYHNGFGENFKANEFDFRSQEGLDNFKKQMEKMQLDVEKITPNKNEQELSKEELDKTKNDMIKAKEEMIKAKEEMEKAKKDLEKAKSSLKTQKA